MVGDQDSVKPKRQRLYCSQKVLEPTLQRIPCYRESWRVDGKGALVLSLCFSNKGMRPVEATEGAVLMFGQPAVVCRI